MTELHSQNFDILINLIILLLYSYAYLFFRFLFLDNEIHVYVPCAMKLLIKFPVTLK